MTTIIENNLTFEQALEALERLVHSLEKGSLPLEEAVAAYEKGQELKKYCQEKLDRAVLKIENLHEKTVTETT